MKNTLFSLIAKMEYGLYASVIVLYVIGAVMTILGMPWLTLGIFALHLFETITIGIGVGRAAGEGLIYSIVMCMMFGFTWWIPTKVKNNI